MTRKEAWSSYMQVVVKNKTSPLSSKLGRKPQRPVGVTCFLFLFLSLGLRQVIPHFLQNCWSQEEMLYQRFKPFISRSVRRETSYHLGAKLIFVQSTKMETCGLKGQVSHEETEL